MNYRGKLFPEILPSMHMGGQGILSTSSALATQVRCLNLQLIRFSGSLCEINECSPSSPIRQNPSGRLAHFWHDQQSEDKRK